MRFVSLCLLLSVSSYKNSEIRYDDRGGYQWGFQIGDEGPRHQWFKLDLDPSQRGGISNLARKFPSRIASPPAYNTDSTRLVTDYLTALREHAVRVLTSKLPKAVLKSTAIEYIIT